MNRNSIEVWLEQGSWITRLLWNGKTLHEITWSDSEGEFGVLATYKGDDALTSFFVSQFVLGDAVDSQLLWYDERTTTAHQKSLEAYFDEAFDVVSEFVSRLKED